MPTTRAQEKGCGILQWKKVTFAGRSALITDKTIAKPQQIFLLKIVDPTLYTNFVAHLVVTPASVVQSEREAKYSILCEVRGFINCSAGVCV